MEELDSLASGAALRVTESPVREATRHFIFIGPDHSRAESRGYGVLKWIFSGLRFRTAFVAPYEHHDMAARTVLIDPECTVVVALGDSFLTAPQYRFIICVSLRYVREGTLRHILRLRTPRVAPEEHHNIAARTDPVDSESTVTVAFGDSPFHCPRNCARVHVVVGNIGKRSLRLRLRIPVRVDAGIAAFILQGNHISLRKRQCARRAVYISFTVTVVDIRLTRSAGSPAPPVFRCRSFECSYKGSAAALPEAHYYGEFVSGGNFDTIFQIDFEETHALSRSALLYHGLSALRICVVGKLRQDVNLILTCCRSVYADAVDDLIVFRFEHICRIRNTCELIHITCARIGKGVLIAQRSNRFVLGHVHSRAA